MNNLSRILSAILQKGRDKIKLRYGREGEIWFYSETPFACGVFPLPVQKAYGTG
jgi:hypothetical protein